MSKNVSQTPVEKLVRGGERLVSFSIIPNEWITDLRLSATFFRLACAIDARQGQKNKQSVYRKLLAQDIGISVATVSRGIKALQDFGILRVQLRGWASVYFLDNPSRIRGQKGSRRITHDTAVISPMTPPQINNSLINKQNKSEPLKALVVVASKGELTNKTYAETALKVITAETKESIILNPLTLETCSRALHLGKENPHTFGLEVAKYYKNAASKQKITNPSGFIVKICMQAVIKGWTQQENKPTPTPPRYNPNQLETLCPTHGEQGHLVNACPPCRQLNREQENVLSVVSI